MKQQLSTLFNEFFSSEKSSAIVLLACTALSLALANSPFGAAYASIWKISAGLTIEHWINDGLMAVFFLLIGLEIERELYIGELNSARRAALPAIAAIGGMLVPAAIYAFFNAGTGTMSGFGIPMATDIAFAIGIMALLGDRVPPALKVFLVALAIIDDMGAIIIIALFYATAISPFFLAAGAFTFAVMLILNRLGIKRAAPYLLLGAALWFFLLKSGIHATIAGVLTAFAVPFGDGGESSPSYRLQHFLHLPVGFVIMPLFALANTCIPVSAEHILPVINPLSLGIVAGLTVGKPLGIVTCSLAAVKTGIARMPERAGAAHILGAGMLAGIGFTMSIFIALLAFDSPAMLQRAKLWILAASVISGVAGYVFLSLVTRPQKGRPAAGE